MDNLIEGKVEADEDNPENLNNDEMRVGGEDDDDEAAIAPIDMGPPIKLSPVDLQKIAETFKEGVKPSKSTLSGLTYATQLDRKDANWCFIKLRHKFKTAKGKPTDPGAIDLFVSKHLQTNRTKIIL